MIICIIVIIWSIEYYIPAKMFNANDSPVLAFARLWCLKIPVVRSAHPAKVTSDLLDSSLQGVPRAFRCRRCISYERKDANSPLQFFHLKFKNRSVCLLCVWLIWRRIGNISKCNASDWLSRLAPTRSVYCNLNSSKIGCGRSGFAEY